LQQYTAGKLVMFPWVNTTGTLADTQKKRLIA